MKRNRHENAGEIWHVGASNALAVANTLVEAIKEVRSEGKTERGDAACMLICDQLAFLLGLPLPTGYVEHLELKNMLDQVQRHMDEANVKIQTAA